MFSLFLFLFFCVLFLYLTFNSSIFSLPWICRYFISLAMFLPLMLLSQSAVQSIDHKNELAASMPHLKGPFGHSPVVRMVISKFRLYIDCLPLPSILSSLAQYISETSVDKINLPISLGMMGTTLLLPSSKTSSQGSPNMW